MNTVLFVNATIVFFENLFLVYIVIIIYMELITIHCYVINGKYPFGMSSGTMIH